MKLIVFIFFVYLNLINQQVFATGKTMPSEEQVDLSCLNISHLDNKSDLFVIDILLELGIPPAKMDDALKGAKRDKLNISSNEFRKSCFIHLMNILKKAYKLN